MFRFSHCFSLSIGLSKTKWKKQNCDNGEYSRSSYGDDYDVIATCMIILISRNYILFVSCSMEHVIYPLSEHSGTTEDHKTPSQFSSIFWSRYLCTIALWFLVATLQHQLLKTEMVWDRLENGELRSCRKEKCFNYKSAADLTTF